MTTKPMKFVRGRVARFTRLDGCGRPVYGDSSVVITEGFVSVAFTANVDSGTEISVPNAAGKTCVYEAAVPKLTGYTIEVTFCEVDPDLYAMATGQATVLDAHGDVVGFDVDTAVDASSTAFALEVWAGAPAQQCTSEASTGTYGYFLVPYLQGGTLGDFTLENGAVSFTLSNSTTREGNSWGTGPYNVVSNISGKPSRLLTPVSPTLALRPMLVGVAPPAATLGTYPLLDPTDVALTGTTKTGTALAATFAPVPAGTDAWWVDFGDGNWDYSATGANISHTYAAAGAYSVVARRGISTVTSSVTVS